MENTRDAIPPFAGARGSVTVERDLFEWLVEYTLDLRGEWEWKRNSTKRNDEEMARLDEHIFKALQIRESPNQCFCGTR